ncbi:MAG: hypothetical protein MK291_04715 [Planctomycetes bacterium]|nr:hypothetical protein [Planctomycetota bacterium]
MLLPALAPALVAGAALLIARRSRAAIAGLAGALGYLTAHTALLGLPELEPVAAVERMPYVLLAIGAVVAMGGVRASSVGDAMLFLVSAAGAWWLTESARANDLAETPGLLLLGGLALVAYASSQLLGTISQRAKPWVAPLLVALASLALAPALVMGRSGSLGQLAGALCAASSAAVVLSLRGDLEREAALMARAAAPALSLLAACGALYAYLDPWAAACLALSPLLAGFGLRRKEEWSTGHGLSAAALLGLLGLWLAYQGMPAPSPYDY